MKSLLVVIIIAVAGWFAWKRFHESAGPIVIEHPIYADFRVDATIENREIQMALFVRSSSETDCRTRARLSWMGAFSACPACNVRMTEPKCMAQLPPRYAKLFDDVPIPSTYLSATSGASDERDGRLVVYGLTDAEGAVLCEMIRSKILEKYKGTAHCVAASGG